MAFQTASHTISYKQYTDISNIKQVKNIIQTQGYFIGHLSGVWIHIYSCVSRSRFNLFFFFPPVFYFLRKLSLFMHCSSTVYALFMGSITTLFKKILKMGPMVLFIHLKIILLQCFQFLVSAKIIFI